MDLIKVLLRIKNEGFTLTFEERVEKNELVTRIVLEKTLLLRCRQEYLVTDDLIKASGTTGLAMILNQMLKMIKSNVKYGTIPKNP